MQSLKERLTAQYRQDPDIVSVVVVENPNRLPSLTDGFDLLLLLVTRSHKRDNRLHYYIKEKVHIQEKRVQLAELEDLLLSDSSSVIQWLLKGEILLDRETYLEGLRNKIVEFPVELREHRLLLEFCRFLRMYLQSKEYLLDEHLLDAYNNILDALHCWARIVIIEEGHHPEITVWRQIRNLNPGVYKLYEELTTSRETVKQRVQLVLLACEFSVMSKMERCCLPLLDILSGREEPWSTAELQQHPVLAEIRCELPLLLNKLVKKSLIREVAVVAESELLELELRYTK